MSFDKLIDLKHFTYSLYIHHSHIHTYFCVFIGSTYARVFRYIHHTQYMMAIIHFFGRALTSLIVLHYYVKKKNKGKSLL